ncbi:sugar ABC transporter substrate-binding protein [Paenibacillus donghaensis]|uniref:ABC transporter substrate-binding protein n=1 Tax=Paenibacillus donghaensis TaxID=414771 RepID=UPI00188464A9|nr:sugar ABC transporter substrate-binding protein [Paenibacillus donghaensis]MBE9917546.1 sugar ABC transporter substrate-binding protein [Paenibacillus donghaensis]
MVKKGLAWLMLLSLMVMTAACGSSDDKNAEDSKDGQETIKFMQYTASGGQEDTLKDIIKKFEEQNPNIKVDAEIVDFQNYTTKLNTMIASKTAPDVFEVGYENFMTYASQNVLRDLSDVIEADKDFNPDKYKKLAYDAFKYNDKQMGMVESFSDVVLFYNKDLFDAKHVAYPQDSWTWKDELAAAQQLTDAKKGIWGTYSPIQFYEFYKTIAQNSGGIFDNDGKPAVNSMANKEALQWMIDKASKYHVSPPLNDDTFSQPDADINAFKSGQIAMFRTGIWNMSRFTDAGFKWDIVLEPGNTQKAHHFFADGLAVSADSKHAEAAWKFLKFMSSDPYVVEQRITKNWSVPAVSDESMLDAYFKQTPPESKKKVMEALDSLVLPPVGPKPDKWNEISTAVGEELDKAKLGASDVQTALDKAQQKLEDILK